MQPRPATRVFPRNRTRHSLPKVASPVAPRTLTRWGASWRPRAGAGLALPPGAPVTASARRRPPRVSRVRTCASWPTSRLDRAPHTLPVSGQELGLDRARYVVAAQEGLSYRFAICEMLKAALSRIGPLDHLESERGCRTQGMKGPRELDVVFGELAAHPGRSGTEDHAVAHGTRRRVGSAALPTRPSVVARALLND
jgi:hypothetical protein